MVRARREDPSFDVRKVVVSNVHPNAPVGTANQGQHCSNARSAPCCRLGLSSLDQFGVLPRPHIFGSARTGREARYEGTRGRGSENGKGEAEARRKTTEGKKKEKERRQKVSLLCKCFIKIYIQQRGGHALVGVFIVRRNTPQYQVQHFFAMRQAVLVRLHARSVEWRRGNA